MRYDEIPGDLRHISYDFFFWFSRFEYALKEARFLRYDGVGSRAEPGWEKFVSAYEDQYQLGEAGQSLIAANPMRQIVTATGLDFGVVGQNAGTSDLERVTVLARTVRNNLFHGGKHGSAYWNQPERTADLLTAVIAVLDDLADQAGLTSDYRSEY